MRNEHNVVDLFPEHVAADEPDLDPCEDPRVKDLMTNYFGAGVRNMYPSDTLRDAVWGDSLPKNLRRAYGTKAPALGGRSPRRSDISPREVAVTSELFNNYRWMRYMHVILGAWASELPLTRDMHKNVLSGWHQEQYQLVMVWALRERLAHETVENWSDMPLFHGKTTEGLHVRPTRDLVYRGLEMIAYFYDCLAENLDDGLYVARLYLPHGGEGRRQRSWPAIGLPILNDISEKRGKKKCR